MAWIKVDDQMVDHPKIEPLSDAAFRWTHRGLSYANRFLTNGVLPPVFLAKVPAACLAELTTVREGQKNPVWRPAENGHAVIHDFKDYQPTKSEVERERKKNRKRQAKWRESHGKNKRVSNGVINGAPSRPGPAPSSTEPPVVPQGGRARKPRRRIGEVPAGDPAAIEQSHDTRRRRAEMAAAGMSDVEIESVLDREYLERKRKAS